MGLGSRVIQGIRDRANEKRAEHASKEQLEHKKKNIDAMASVAGKAQYNKEYADEYYKQRMAQQKEQARERARQDVQGRPHGTSRSARIAGVSSKATAGLNFLNSGQASGPQIASNINSLLGFGGSTHKKGVNPNKPKAKVTTVRTGGKTITIREKLEDGDQPKKERSIADNINDLLKLG